MTDVARTPTTARAEPGGDHPRAPIGHLLDRFPYVRAGTGERTLAVLPGFGDAMFDGTYPPGTNWLLWGYFRRYLDDYTVYVLSRPRHLPEGATISGLADDYATVLAALPGPTDVLGISMGGMNGMELAVRHPDAIDRLVVTSSGIHVADDARPAVERLLALARDRDWAAIRARLADAMFTDWRRVAYPASVLTVGRLFMPRPADPGDVTTSLEAILAYDGSETATEIETPTLVVGGTDDPYFPESVQRETTDAIAGSQLSLIDGGRHGAFHERKHTFDSRVRAFLAP